MNLLLTASYLIRRTQDASIQYRDGRGRGGQWGERERGTMWGERERGTMGGEGEGDNGGRGGGGQCGVLVCMHAFEEGMSGCTTQHTQYSPRVAKQ